MRKRTWIIAAAAAGLVLGGATVAAAAVNPFDDAGSVDEGTQSPLSQADRDKAVQAALAKVERYFGGWAKGEKAPEVPVLQASGGDRRRNPRSTVPDGCPGSPAV